MASRDDDDRRSTMDRRAQTHQSGFARTAFRIPEGYELYKFEKEGSVRLDFMGYRVGKGNPYAAEGAMHPERTFFTHRDIGPNEDTYVCLAKTFNEPCPICEYRAVLLARGADRKSEEIKALLPKERQLWLVRDLNVADSAWQLMELSFAAFGKLLDKRIKERDPDENFHKFHYPLSGSMLKIGITENPLPGGKWYEATTIDFKPRAQPYPKGLPDEMPCLDDLIIKTPYEKLKRIFLQLGEDQELTGDEAPPAKKPAAAKGRAAMPSGDEDEAPPPKKKAPAPPPADDWEEDAPPPKKKAPPAPVAEEDEDAPPPPKKKPAPAPVAEDDWEEAPPPPPKKKPAPPPPDED
jgi:hypothetical protein